MIPCRRCQLYSLVCEYPPSSGPAPSKPAVPRITASSSSSSALSALPQYVPQLYPSPSTAQDTLMSDRLREISERLRSIEASLSQVHLSSQSHSHGHHEHSPNSMPSMHHSISSPDSTTSSYAADDQPGSGANLASAVQAQHALQTISDTLGLMEAMDKGNKAESEGAGGDTTNGSAPASGGGGSTYQTASTMPPRDAIERGILSVAECEANFKMWAFSWNFYRRSLADLVLNSEQLLPPPRSLGHVLRPRARWQHRGNAHPLAAPVSRDPAVNFLLPHGLLGARDSDLPCPRGSRQRVDRARPHLDPRLPSECEFGLDLPEKRSEAAQLSPPNRPTSSELSPFSCSSSACLSFLILLVD